VHFNPCQDCGPNYAVFVLLALLWEVPVAWAVIGRHTAADLAQARRRRAVAFAFGALALLVSWRYMASPWL
jgi:hypothetical protein